MEETRIDHIGVAVRSLEEAERFYRDVLGLSIERETLEDRKLEVAMVKVGDSRIELLEPMEGEETISKYIEKRGEGIHHIALSVKNLDEVLKRVTEHGIRSVGKPSAGAGGKRVVFLHPKDLNGVLLELVEEPDE